MSTGGGGSFGGSFGGGGGTGSGSGSQTTGGSGTGSGSGSLGGAGSFGDTGAGTGGRTTSGGQLSDVSGQGGSTLGAALLNLDTQESAPGGAGGLDLYARQQREINRLKSRVAVVEQVLVV
jgi:hypothetical protein